LNIDEGEITPEEVYRVIKKMKNGKAPGINGIPAELIKSGGKEMIKRLTNCVLKFGKRGKCQVTRKMELY